MFDPDGGAPYAVEDAAGTTPGPGCATETSVIVAQNPRVLCPAAAVQSIVIRLGDGDDSATMFVTRVPVSVYGEGGKDQLPRATLADGGEGDDVLSGGDDVRGGPGDDFVTGSRLLDGGDGNDTLHKTGGTAGGTLSGGAGDDRLQSNDGLPDLLQCGAGKDVVGDADASDRNDGTCEVGKGVTPKLPPVKAQVTVFELPKARSRPGRDGRLAVWMKCSEPKCAVTVRLVSVSSRGLDDYAAFRNPPLLRLVVGEKAKLVRLKLNAAQRRAMSRSDVGSGVGAVVTTLRPGKDAKMLTDGLYCRRADPCVAR